MEGGKRTEEVAGSSSGVSSACGVDENKREIQKEMTNIPFEVRDVVEEDEAEEEEHIDDNKDEGVVAGFVPGPLLPLKEQIEKDKDDDSLRRWKEQLLGCLESDLDGTDPEVKFHSIGIVSDDLGEVVTPLPLDETQGVHVLFSLKEGSCYQLKLKFTVLHNIVSGLTYSNTVWKGGLQVDQMKGMLGTFAPQQEPYVHALDEETTPSGVLARGIYTAKLKFEDDDRRCHMELNYSFEIKKSS
ncbi:Rho GDP-dissociation inhibitor 1 [Quillaja saponaria]|uniref:Rho GDP-dissociation inhibitor 1 n=1 Tax=Quillaja saponaria TaxID=32244 RepID=A0AAD7Q9J0_QUISA|nr:Rho GDP-dissociation inhibitor 1 [Quillaja saponaria]